MDFRRPASEFPNDNLDLHDGALWRCRSVTGAARAIARPKPHPLCQPAKMADPTAEQEADPHSHAAPRTLVSPNAPAGQAPVSACTIVPPAASEAEPLGTSEASPPAASGTEPPAAVRPAASAAEPPAASAAEPLGTSEASPPAASATEPPAASAAEPPSSGPSVARVSPAEPPPREPSVAFDNLLATLAEVALGRGATRAAAVVADLFRAGSIPAELLSRSAIDAGLAAGILVERGSHVALCDDTFSVAQAWRGALEGQRDLANIGHSTLDGYCSELLAVLSGDPASISVIRRELRARGVAAFGLLDVAA